MKKTEDKSPELQIDLAITNQQLCESDIEELRIWITEVRRAFADYYVSEGCSCCRDHDKHEAAEERLAELLNPKRYDDDSGFNWHEYSSEG